ncbi:MAG: stearoyl-CoA desaturase (delta-9 desaturase) [Candidatus Paceibacteria bacterium]
MNAHGDAARPRATAWKSLVRWLDSWAEDERDVLRDPHEIDWLRVVPFGVLHLSCLLVFVVGWSWTAVGVAVAAYAIRMFAITGFYHRYFSHRSFQTSRLVQFVFALVGMTAIQRGPIWWASHHRAHHQHSDRAGDVHSPVRDGFWWSHVGWILCRGNFRPRLELVPDLTRFPELRFLDRFDILVPLLSLGGFYLLGESAMALGLETTGGQLVVWGFCLSTIFTHHMTFCINSVAHRVGSRRYETQDDSRNNWLLSLFTFGEGWHNNHHRYQGSVRQGFRWWEIDFTYYVLRGLALFGLVWRLSPVPVRIIEEGRKL